MTVKAGVSALLEGKLDAMKTEFSTALYEKAVEKLEEKKIVVAKNYLGLSEAKK